MLRQLRSAEYRCCRIDTNLKALFLVPVFSFQAELQELQLGQAIERIPARPGQRIPYENTTKRPPPLKPDPFEGTWEVLTVDEAGEPFLDRHDSWAWIGRTTPSSSLPKGFSFQ